MTTPPEKPIHYRCDLDGQLQTCIQDFEEKRQEHWQENLEGTDWDLREGILGHADALARAVLYDAERMTCAKPRENGAQFEIEREAFLSSISATVTELRAIMSAKFRGRRVPRELWELAEHLALEDRPQSDTLAKLVWERLCITLAWDMAKNRLVQGANRLMQLVGILVQTEVPPQTMEFLCRVSRCFVWGFDPECVILCRGAIDTAFKEAVGDRLCAKHGEPAAKYGYTLAQRIDVAGKEGLIDEDTRKAARGVNRRATDAAHKDPNIGGDVLKTIRDTLIVIQKLGAR